MILEGVRRIDADGTERVVSVRIGDDRGPAVDGRGLIVMPGLIDLHAHLREPGFEESETIATGARAALRGGFTTVCAMANTIPAIDSPGLVAEIVARGREAKGARVLPAAAITRGRLGKELADLIELAAAGAVAFSDDGDPVDDARLFRSALEYAHAARRPVFEHAMDRALAARGVMHEGAVSADLGLPGIPAAAEESAVARDLAIAKLAGARLHLQHVSTAGALELVRRAKADGLLVTCEVTAHHLSMTDDWVAGSRAFVWQEGEPRTTPYDSATKVNPPLRPEADVRALWRGIADGTVDAIATDHAPHASVRKDVEYAEAAFGIGGIETALSVLLMAVEAGMGELGPVVRALTSGPARVLDMRGPDDLIVVDPAREWTVTPEALASTGKNTPLMGRVLRGKVIAAVVDGEVRYRDDVAMTAWGRAEEPSAKGGRNAATVR